MVNLFEMNINSSRTLKLAWNDFVIFDYERCIWNGNRKMDQKASCKMSNSCLAKSARDLIEMFLR